MPTNEPMPEDDADKVLRKAYTLLLEYFDRHRMDKWKEWSYPGAIEEDKEDAS